jgi:hypothetical protein
MSNITPMKLPKKTMVSFRASIIIAAAAVLSSCANVSSDFAFKRDGTTGLVVGSVSYETGLGKYFLVVQNVETLAFTEFGFGCPIFPCLEPADDEAYSRGELPKQRGGGYAIEVPEGRYRIVGWHVRQGYMSSRSKRPVDIPFTVERGKASYMGNLHFDPDWEAVQLRDKASRDLPILQTRYAAMKVAEFAYMIAPGVDIVGFGGEYQRGIEGQIYIPMIPFRR